jgi:hypothetical protein
VAVNVTGWVTVGNPAVDVDEGARFSGTVFCPVTGIHAVIIKRSRTELKIFFAIPLPILSASMVLSVYKLLPYFNPPKDKQRLHSAITDYRDSEPTK